MSFLKANTCFNVIVTGEKQDLREMWRSSLLSRRLCLLSVIYLAWVS